MKPWHIYLVECCDKSLYCGITTDVKRRVEEHNQGRGAKYTRSRRPVHLVGAWQIGSRSEALKVERAVKKLAPQQKRDCFEAIVRDMTERKDNDARREQDRKAEVDRLPDEGGLRPL